MSIKTTDVKNVTDTNATLTGYDGRPGDCDCLPTFDTNGLGCWPCYQNGFKTANPNATDDDAGEE